MLIAGNRSVKFSSFRNAHASQESQISVWRTSPLPLFGEAMGIVSASAQNSN